MKKILVAILSIAMAIGVGAMFAACGGDDKKNENGEMTSGAITVIMRESGSGTRSAFLELIGLEETQVTPEAEESNSTNVVKTSVASNARAIGYISMGSLDNTVKAVKVGGAEATTEKVLSGDYKLSRPFNVAYKQETYDSNDLLRDFLKFVQSKQGQAIVSEEGYVTNVADPAEYTATTLTTKTMTISGSSSVTPLMQKLVPAYQALNAGVTITINQSDSGTGMKDAMEGRSALGMASRELKDDEKAALKNVVLAIDGIAVIVNNNNAVSDLTMEQIKNIYNGTTTNWSELN